VTRLNAEMASRMARIALGHVAKEYPHKLDHVMTGPDDVRSPRDLHPVFFGSYDWHSCVHGWWTLLTLRRLFPEIAEASAIEELADGSFTAEKVGTELDYLKAPSSRGFERPYGWAWVLYLHLEASRHTASWESELAPLARAFADRLRDYLTIMTYPIRVGTHFNTCFALTLSLEWATKFDPGLADVIRDRALHWFGTDRDCQAWEPGGDEFLSSALMEALCMARTQPADFAAWIAWAAAACSARRRSASVRAVEASFSSFAVSASAACCSASAALRGALAGSGPTCATALAARSGKLRRTRAARRMP